MPLEGGFNNYYSIIQGDIMPMPGAGDSYFYEWYVGLENVIKMLNPDSGIRCVIFVSVNSNSV